MIKIITKCKNCSKTVEGNFCSNCGQEYDVKRFTMANLSAEFIHGFFHVHSSLPHTIKELFIHPWEMLRGYITGKRVVYFNSFTYLVLISLAGGFLYDISGLIDHASDNFLASPETILFTSRHFSYRMLLSIPFYAILCQIMFRSYKYNFAEHLIINTYLISQTVFIFTIWLLVFRLVKLNDNNFKFLFYTNWISVIIYQIVVFFRLFNSGNLSSRWFKSTVVVIAGLSLSSITMNMLAGILNVK